MMGPLEYMVIGFDGDRISPEIVREIDAVRDDGTVRMLDLMIIAKDGNGGVSSRQMSDLSEADAQALGMVDDDPDDGRTSYGWLSDDDMASVGATMPVSSSAIVMLFEHAWAAQLRAAIIDAGGFLLAQERIPPEGAAEVEAMLGRKE
jgi:uncharacterized membrane protein